MLVATDCLSEGINLQDHFDAVVHYDLSWNPTRHEQREGRVDRFGQPRPSVRVVTYYGVDNPVDGVVLDVLLRKHDEIRAITRRLGAGAPSTSDTVMEAILEGMVTRGAKAAGNRDQLALFEREVVAPRRRGLHEEWDSLAEREQSLAHDVRPRGHPRRGRPPRAAGRPAGDRRRRRRPPLLRPRAGGARRQRRRTATACCPPTCPRRRSRCAMRSAAAPPCAARFRPPAGDGEELLTRTHPVVEGLASHVLDTALDPLAGDAVAARSGVMRTRDVTRRTTALLLRMRFHLTIRRGEQERRLLAEDARVLAFAGIPGGAGVAVRGRRRGAADRGPVRRTSRLSAPDATSNARSRRSRRSRRR